MIKRVDRPDFGKGRKLPHFFVAFVLLSLLIVGCDIGAPASPTPAPTAVQAQPPATGVKPTTSSADNPGGASPEALAYMTYALDYIQEHVLNSDEVDWPAVRRHVFGPDMTAQTTEDTYPAIEYVLGQLKVNGHSSLMTPEQVAQMKSAFAATLGLDVSYAQRKVTRVEAGGLAEKAGVRADDTIVTINDSPPESLEVTAFFAQLYFGTTVKLGLRRGDNQSITAEISHDPVDPASMVRGRRLGGDIGYIAVPPVGDTPVLTYVAGIMHQIIEDIDRTPTCGWVVDLQGNTGGNMWSMLAGIGPVLGEGRVGSFVGSAESVPWSYSDGQTLAGDEVVMQVDRPYHVKRPNPPVAVLTDGDTASAGEAILIAFRGRPDTRSFGEPSFGVPTANSGAPLSDGAVLVLTTLLEADRTGHVYGYDEKIQPDVAVTANSFWRGNDKDSVLQAGVEWLNQQPACANR